VYTSNVKARRSSFGQRLIHRMFEIVAGEAAQDRFGFGRAKAQGSRVFDHLAILLANQIPVDRARQRRLKIRICVCLPGLRAIEFLRLNRLQARRRLKAEQMTGRECHFRWAVAVHVVLLDLGLRIMSQLTFQCSSCRRRSVERSI
jgi:hypothetical protein